jgi:hypothetical protein
MDQRSNPKLGEPEQRAASGGRGSDDRAKGDAFGYGEVEQPGQLEMQEIWNEGGGQDQTAVTQAMRHREVGASSPGGDFPGGYGSFKANSMLTDSQNDGEPGRCPDSSLRTDGVDDKIRLIQAKEIVTNHQQDLAAGGGLRQQLIRTQERNHVLERRLAEADELIGQMSKLIDISRNKQLQRMLI